MMHKDTKVFLMFLILGFVIIGIAYVAHHSNLTDEDRQKIWPIEDKIKNHADTLYVEYMAQKQFEERIRWEEENG